MTLLLIVMLHLCCYTHRDIFVEYNVSGCMFLKNVSIPISHIIFDAVVNHSTATLCVVGSINTWYKYLYDLQVVLGLAVSELLFFL